MRVGQNPAKNVREVVKPERITVAVLNYIPFVGGFYAEMPAVLRRCLDSIWSTADLPFDLLVFDNGSCREVVDYLVEQKDAGRIQYLMLSDKNLGKGGAWNAMLAAAPGEIIAYADNDVLFYSTWLSESVKLLETYPNVGMVTARPYRTPPEFYSSTLEWAKSDPNVDVEEGQLVPFDTLHEFNLSLGQEDDYSRGLIENSQDVRLTYNGLPAYAGASHWQFTAYKQTIQAFLPFAMDKPMGQVRRLDKRVNDAGLLRLMTAQPLAMNMSNSLESAGANQQTVTPGKKKSNFWETGLVKKVLLAVHDRIFKLYYRN